MPARKNTRKSIFYRKKRVYLDNELLGICEIKHNTYNNTWWKNKEVERKREWVQKYSLWETGHYSFHLISNNFTLFIQVKVDVSFIIKSAIY